VLADLALGKLRKKIPALREALTSRFSGHHAVIVASILSKLDFLDELIANLSTEIEQAIAPFAHQVGLLDTIPGIDQRTAQGCWPRSEATWAYSAPPPGWRPGPRSVRVTTSRPAGPSLGPPARGRDGWVSTCTTRPWVPCAPRTPT
jgi:hypothetical protein